MDDDLNDFENVTSSTISTSTVINHLKKATLKYTTSEEYNCTVDPLNSTVFVFSEADSTAAWAIASFCAVTGSIFNLVTILALLNHKPTRRHVTTPFVISLSCSDLLFSSVTLPIMAVRFYSRDWSAISSETGFFCQIFPVLFYGNTAVTLLNIMAVTINRWSMIYFPNASERIFTRTRSKIFIAICWIAPVLILSPSFFKVWGKHGIEERTQSCTILPDDRGRSPKVTLMTIGVVIPSIILIIANSMICYKIVSIRKRMEYETRNSNVTLPKGLKEREQRLTKMMLLIFACFVITYMPSYFVKAFVDKNYCFSGAHIACYVINWLAVVMDPSIYVATQERYRLALKLLWLRVKYVRHPERYLQEFRRPSYHLSQIRSTSGDN